MMPAGTYYIGDLCYVMDNDEWDAYCKIVIDGHRCKQGEFVMEDGRRLATYNTAYGDGEYVSNIGTSHLVDSGSIGCIRIEDIRANKYDDLTGLGAIVEFKSEFRTDDNDGQLIFGHVVIDTSPEYDDDLDYNEE